MKEWQLIQEGEQFMTTERSLDNSGPATVRNFVFDRGDVVDIIYGENLVNGMKVERDQELLRFRSMMHNLRIQRALNDISVQESLRDASSAPMKWTLSSEARQNIELARSNLKLQQANHERLNSLFDSGVISKAELDAQVNRMEVAQQELEIAEQRLANTTFEQKAEEQAVFDQRIAALDRELDVLLAQQSSYKVSSPIEGLVDLNPTEGVVLSVRDTSSRALVFQFPVKEKAAILDASFVDLGEHVEGEITPFVLKSEVMLQSGVQNCLGVAYPEGLDADFGEIISARVVCDTITLREYLYRKLL